MFFEERELNNFYDEKGHLKEDAASFLFISCGKEELLTIDKKVLVDVILESREVFAKSADTNYAATTMLAACMSALIYENKSLTEMFMRLTDGGTRNMTQEELLPLLQGFAIAEGDTINALRAVDMVLNGKM